MRIRLPREAMVLMLALSGSLLLFAAGLLVGPEVHEAETEALLKSLRQASARCASTPKEPGLQATVIDRTPPMK